MTNDELKQYYADLLILQYKGNPKAYATIEAIAELIVMNQLPNQVLNAYDLDTAVGVQLDVLGKYAGVDRYGTTFSGNITLDDDDFRTYIKVAIAQNSNGSSLYDIQTLLWNFFEDALVVIDYQSMSISYIFNESIGSRDLAEMFVNDDRLPRPMGVKLAGVVYEPTDEFFFGMRTYNAAGFHARPFNTYDDYQTDWPWLTYDDVIVP